LSNRVEAVIKLNTENFSIVFVRLLDSFPTVPYF
jgi:hypothetical protein